MRRAISLYARKDPTALMISYIITLKLANENPVPENDRSPGNLI